MQGGLQLVAKLTDDLLRGEDLHLVAEGEEPGKKLRAADNADGDLKSISGDRLQRHFLTETVDDDADQFLGEAQAEGGLCTAEHAENFLGVERHVKGLEVILAFSGTLGNGHALHLVHTVMLDHAGLAVVADEVVIFILPGQRPGADDVAVAAVPVFFANLAVFIDDPAKIAEADLASAGNGGVETVNIVIDMFVDGFDAVGHIDLPLQGLGFVAARKSI